MSKTALVFSWHTAAVELFTCGVCFWVSPHRWDFGTTDLTVANVGYNINKYKVPVFICPICFAGFLFHIGKKQHSIHSLTLLEVPWRIHKVLWHKSMQQLQCCCTKGTRGTGGPKSLHTDSYPGSDTCATKRQDHKAATMKDVVRLWTQHNPLRFRRCVRGALLR